MNTETFITKRILFNRSGESRMSKPVIFISIASIAIGLMFMISSVAVVTGFQSEIKAKVIGFGSHIQIRKYDLNSSYEPSPIRIDSSIYPGLNEVDGIKHIQIYAIKAGILKTGEDIMGVMLKGVSTDYDWTFIKNNLLEGDILSITDSAKTNGIILSKKIADKLQLKIGDKIIAHFFNDKKERFRNFTLTGTYNAGIEEFDKIGYADIKHIRKLNNWNPDEIAGYEVLIDDFDKLDAIHTYLLKTIDYDLNAESIKQISPHIFEWLALSDTNVAIIIIIIIFVAVISMISTILILILERTNMIGILKSLGASDSSIGRIFTYHAMYILGLGMLIGNVLGITICLIQDKTHLITLNQEQYYIDHVPIQLELIPVLLVNLLVIAAVALFMFLAARLVTKISPVKAIRFS